MYVRRTSATKATNDSGTSIQGRNAAASCKPIYTGIHLRRTCVSKEAMERLPLSNPEGSLMACPQPYRSLMMPAQHFEPGILPSATDLSELHLRKWDAARNNIQLLGWRSSRKNFVVFCLFITSLIMFLYLKNSPNENKILFLKITLPGPKLNHPKTNFQDISSSFKARTNSKLEQIVKWQLNQKISPQKTRCKFKRVTNQKSLQVNTLITAKIYQSPKFKQACQQCRKMATRPSNQSTKSLISLKLQSLFKVLYICVPLIRQSQDSYQPSQRQLQRQLPRSTMLVQVPNQLRLSEEAIQSDNPRR
ncbi:Hypothetical_protein [Hexamita inflata]|uniref:Hypothetical_protein n=1 Tax=Hexamita inflata TaxID=28002 RepID=A0AA86P0C0_9EUKA|nr:Hypothetical protein HINF_LOCUS17772 [Hexamita inflata]